MRSALRSVRRLQDIYLYLILYFLFLEIYILARPKNILVDRPSKVDVNKNNELDMSKVGPYSANPPVIKEDLPMHESEVEQALQENPELEWEIKELYHGRSPYTPEQKIHAVTAYLITGNSIQASKHCGIPAARIRLWKTKASWWPSTFAKVKKKKQEELDALLTNIVHDAVAAIGDRIHNGDEALTKEGEIIRKKMSGRDLAVITGVVFDKRALLRGEPTSRKETVSTQEHLDNLIKRFEQVTRDQEAKLIEGEVIYESSTKEEAKENPK